MIHYEKPQDWIRYDPPKLLEALAEAKAAVISLKSVPYQRRWVDRLQQIELKREVAGTSRIEGADFTERELDLAMRETPEQLKTRSQRQARAAVNTYRWIAALPQDLPIDAELIKSIHRLIVTDADDDHCPPGRLRQRDENVHFGIPQHRGCEGGDSCEAAFNELTNAIGRSYRDHDQLVQSLAAHYHFAAMHPFLDGNGRTARALEALMLQRAGLRDTSFVAMSNYYYDEKTAYLGTLAETRQTGHDLTPFLLFGLKGIALQCQRLMSEIQHEISKELFRNLMYDLFGRLKTSRKRVIAERQIEVLKALLDVEEIEWSDLIVRLKAVYEKLKNPIRGLVRDVNYLQELEAIRVVRINEGPKFMIKIRLSWPTQITETSFFEKVKKMPKAKTHSFLG